MNVNWHADIGRRERTHGAKRSINLLKKHMKNILRLVVVYKVLIKPGSGSRISVNCRI